MNQKKEVFLIAIFCIPIFLMSCMYKGNKGVTKKNLKELIKDDFTYRGSYTWTFNSIVEDQVSTHTFYPNHISYKIKSNVYTTNYNMKKLSYEKDKDKWIGEDKNGVVYVLFFKNKTDTTITIYKHKCKDKGLEEALDFTCPKLDATYDHGWDVYTLNGYITDSILVVSGEFIRINHKVSISDKYFVIGDKTVEKMSFHRGEKRWVGKYKNQYLQVFFKTLDNPDKLELSINWFTDLEALYKIKYESINDWKGYVRRKYI